jgi:hypothetical protein
VVLRRGDRAALAVDRPAGRGVDDAPDAADLRGPQHVDRAFHVHARVECRVGHRPAHVDLRRQVEDHLRPTPSAQLRHGVRVADVSRLEVGAVSERRLEILAPAGRDVV